MQTDRGTAGGVLILAAVLIVSQLVLLLIVILRVVDSIPKVDPIKVQTVESRSVFDRSVRTVQSPPVKVEADETTDHVP